MENITIDELQSALNRLDERVRALELDHHALGLRATAKATAENFNELDAPSRYDPNGIFPMDLSNVEAYAGMKLADPAKPGDIKYKLKKESPTSVSFDPGKSVDDKWKSRALKLAFLNSDLQVELRDLKRDHDKARAERERATAMAQDLFFKLDAKHAELVEANCMITKLARKEAETGAEAEIAKDEAFNLKHTRQVKWTCRGCGDENDIALETCPRCKMSGNYSK